MTDKRKDKYSRYINEFLHLKCAPDMLERKLFPNAKEITKSFGIYRAVKDALIPGSLASDDITLLAIGDGHTPRTGATFAFRSRWACHSVDPNLRPNQKFLNIARLTCHSNYIEHVHFPYTDELVIIAAMHSHANLDNAIKKCTGPNILVVAVECCVPQIVHDENGKVIQPYMAYVDNHIWSPKNEVKKWWLRRDSITGAIRGIANQQEAAIIIDAETPS